MTKAQDEGFKKTLRHMLKTPPKPHESGDKSRNKRDKDSIPADDANALMDWGKRNIQNEKD